MRAQSGSTPVVFDCLMSHRSCLTTGQRVNENIIIQDFTEVSALLLELRPSNHQHLFAFV